MIFNYDQIYLSKRIIVKNIILIFNNLALLLNIFTAYNVLKIS